MIIKNIHLKTTGKQLKLSADVTFLGTKTQTMYFLTDKKNKQFITCDASPFLAALLIPCMKTKENIYIDGSISEKLLNNTTAIMTQMNKWNKGLSRVKIKCKIITKDTTRPKFIGCFFSAGIDSFYTYLKFRKTINTFIFIDGFDIELENKTLFRKTLNNILAVAKKENVNVIAVETNVKNIIEPVYIWDWVHGGALAAVSLFLRKDLKQIHISGAVRKDQLYPYGTHPDLDYLWSTEKLEIIHTGTEYSRFEKIFHYIAKSDIALSFLHVCSENTKNSYNCSRCGKCLRTMIQLTGANVLHKAKTFEHKLDLNLVRKMYYDYSHNYQVQAEPVIDILTKEQRELDLVNAIKESLYRSKKGPTWLAKLVNAIAYFDLEYNHRRFYTFVFGMNKKHDRNVVFKAFVNLGVIH